MLSFAEVWSFNSMHSSPTLEKRNYSPGRIRRLGVATEETVTDLEGDLIGSSRSLSSDQEGDHDGIDVVGSDQLESDNKRHEYQMNLGRALDYIRRDYPDLLLKPPDFSIYHEDIEVVDPSGMTLHGLSNYKRSFQFVHSIVRFFYCTEHSGIDFRLFYDFAQDSIRVSWHATLAPKQLYGGIENKLRVDGMSVYKVDRESGLVNSHRIENLLINNTPLEAPQGIMYALRNEVVSPLGVPAGQTVGLAGENIQQQSTNRDDGITTLMPMTSNLPSYSRENSSDLEFERKNASRAKFGLKPITREEFDKIEEQVRAQSDLVAGNYRSAAELRAEKKEKEYGFLGKLFGDSLPDTCESNADCDRPTICCDLIVKKVCCATGVKIPVSDYTPKMVPAMIPIRPGDGQTPKEGYNY